MTGVAGQGLYGAVRGVAAMRPAAEAIRALPAKGRPSESVSYGELIARVDSIAAGLRERGVGEGATVATVLRNTIDYVALILAVARLGARYVPLLANFGADEVKGALALARPTLLITDRHRDVAAHGVPRAALSELRSAASSEIGLPETEPLPEPSAPSSVFRMLWTSGSTGLPKAMVWRQDKFVRERRRWLADVGVTESDRLFCRHTLDVAHATDLHVFAALLSGATLILADPDASPAELLEQLAAERATMMSALPQHYADLVEAAEALPADKKPDLRRLRPLCGGAQLSKDLIARTDRVLGIRLRQIYGSTEFGLALGDLRDVVQDDAGMVPVDGVGVRLVPLHSQTPDLGQLILLSDCTSEGYVNADAANAKTFRSGEFWTGDVAIRLAGGRYRIVGRVTETVAGWQGPILAPQLDEEIEATGCVAQTVSLAAYEHEYRNEVLIAVRRSPATTQDKAKKAIDEILDRRGLQGSLLFVDEFPRTPVGKVDKPSLRRLWQTVGAQT